MEPFKVLFLCTGNSARSIFGEFLMRKVSKGAFHAVSAGARPRAEVNPYTLRVLREVYHLDTGKKHFGTHTQVLKSGWFTVNRTAVYFGNRG